MTVIAALALAVIVAPWVYAIALDITRRTFDEYWDWDTAPVPAAARRALAS